MRKMTKLGTKNSSIEKVKNAMNHFGRKIYCLENLTLDGPVRSNLDEMALNLHMSHFYLLPSFHGGMWMSLRKHHKAIVIMSI